MDSLSLHGLLNVWDPVCLKRSESLRFQRIQELLTIIREDKDLLVW